MPTESQSSPNRHTVKPKKSLTGIGYKGVLRMNTVTLRRFRNGDEFAVSDVICTTLAISNRKDYSPAFIGENIRSHAPKVIAAPRRRFAAILPEAAQRNNLENVMFCSPTEVFRQGLPRVAATLPITEATKYEASIRLLKPIKGDGLGFMSWREGPNEHFFMRISRDELRGTVGFWSMLFL